MSWKSEAQSRFVVMRRDVQIDWMERLGECLLFFDQLHNCVCCNSPCPFDLEETAKKYDCHRSFWHYRTGDSPLSCPNNMRRELPERPTNRKLAKVFDIG